jgi:pyruvate/2-oxoglutarate dehydrogenase complex dihydrolipoamide acyltransferase (E2) component
MATPLHTPRVNNNDDVVRLIRLLVKPGDVVRAGDIVAEVETDKASFTVEAERPGVVLALRAQVNDMVTVGSVLMWVGDSADEPVPDIERVSPAGEAATGAPTVKAAQLLAQHGLRAQDVPASGDRLTARDVETFIAARGSRPAETPVPITTAAAPPSQPGTLQPLTPEERAMARTVLWHRQEAVPGYVELQYDTAAWTQVAAEFQKRERLLFNPLLPLLAYRLVRLAAGNPRLNATLAGDGRFEYQSVNLGFTVQTDTTLYLVVVERAGELTCAEFVGRLTQLQRNAMAHRLRAPESSGATIAFTSMARWKATRHIPVLPPHTALIVAHAGDASEGRGTLGATYDHRVLTGADALAAIDGLSRPEEIL